MKHFNAFIPAAGLGERLRPITAHLPKPLLPICGKPVIERIMERILLQPVLNIGINSHYHGDMLQQWAAGSAWSDRIVMFPEEPILGTGGALKNAQSLLGQDAFLVHNSDIVTDADLHRLMELHLASGNLATLAVHHREPYNTVWIDRNGLFRNVGSAPPSDASGLCKIAFMGIAVYQPDFLAFLPDGPSSVIDAWRAAVASGAKIGTVDFSGVRWSDIGTPSAYAQEVFSFLSDDGETVYLPPSFSCSHFRIDGPVVIEKGCSIGEGAILDRSILLPGGSVAPGASALQVISGPDYVISIPEEENSEDLRLIAPEIRTFFAGRPRSRLIGTGGSDRRYYRLDDGRQRAVLMQCREGDEDFSRHIAYTRFFREHGIPVPVLFAEASAAYQALFSDLGDISLYSWLKCSRTSAEIADIYQRLLAVLAELHGPVSRSVEDCPLLADRRLDYDHLRWETAYFLERFVRDVCGITPEEPAALDDEFHLLAREVDSMPKAVVHRDCQSQNVMITHDSLVWLIDFQGSRIGCAAYDIASLLWDPYAPLDTDLRSRLISYYIACSSGKGKQINASGFDHELLLCRLQRHMQALGAYGFLSRVKGKKYFLKHAPQAVLYLAEEAEATRERFPVLHKLVATVRTRFS